jgi:hypothetical protein
MDTRSIMAPLNAAAASLAALARNIGAKGAELRNSLHAEQVRRQLMSAAEDLRDAAREAATSARNAAAPHARELAASTLDHMESLRDGVASGAQALVTQMKKPNVISRHPYATVLVVAGACFVAVSQWRRRRAAQPARPRAAAARKSANGASRTAARKRAAAAASKAPAAVH